MQIGTRESILAAQDRAEATVDVPEWGCAVRIRELSKAAIDKLRQEIVKNEDGTVELGRFRQLLFVYAVVEPQFTLEDIPALWDKHAHAVETVLEAIDRLGGTTQEGETSEAAVADAEKSFRRGQPEDVSIPAGGEPGHDGGDAEGDTADV
jgi:hypothetical protein